MGNLLVARAWMRLAGGLLVAAAAAFAHDGHGSHRDSAQLAVFSAERDATPTQPPSHPRVQFISR